MLVRVCCIWTRLARRTRTRIQDQRNDCKRFWSLPSSRASRPATYSSSLLVHSHVDITRRRSWEKGSTTPRIKTCPGCQVFDSSRDLGKGFHMKALRHERMTKTHILLIFLLSIFLSHPCCRCCFLQRTQWSSRMRFHFTKGINRFNFHLKIQNTSIIQGSLTCLSWINTWLTRIIFFILFYSPVSMMTQTVQESFIGSRATRLENDIFLRRTRYTRDSFPWEIQSQNQRRREASCRLLPS